jgi:hypothetical protein
MTGTWQGWPVLVLAVGLAWPSGAYAGEKHHLAGCPRASYSPIHYWAPALNRLYWHCQTPSVGVYAPPSCVPPRYLDVRFPCPAVDPAYLPRNQSLATPPPAPPAGAGSDARPATMPPARTY